MDKAQFLKNTKAFPGTTVVTFDGKKVSLDELRGGSGQSFSTASSATPCPRCKSTMTVTVGNEFACNACGNTWR
jgi:hypothetical protein